MEPATEDEIAALIQAGSTEGDIPLPGAQEDVVLSDHGVLRDIEPDFDTQSEPSPASREMMPRSAIIKAHESARERRRRQTERAEPPFLNRSDPTPTGDRVFDDSIACPPAAPAPPGSPEPSVAKQDTADRRDDAPLPVAGYQAPADARDDDRFDRVPERNTEFELPLLGEKVVGPPDQNPRQPQAEQPDANNGAAIASEAGTSRRLVADDSGQRDAPSAAEDTDRSHDPRVNEPASATAAPHGTLRYASRPGPGASALERSPVDRSS